MIRAVSLIRSFIEGGVTAIFIAAFLLVSAQILPTIDLWLRPCVIAFSTGPLKPVGPLRQGLFEASPMLDKSDRCGKPVDIIWGWRDADGTVNRIPPIALPTNADGSLQQRLPGVQSLGRWVFDFSTMPSTAIEHYGVVTHRPGWWTLETLIGPFPVRGGLPYGGVYLSEGEGTASPLKDSGQQAQKRDRR